MELVILGTGLVKAGMAFIGAFGAFVVGLYAWVRA